MTLALADAGVAPETIGYINAHGTSTPFGDEAEVLAVKRVFGSHAARLALNSTKSMTGHTLRASGAIEAAYTSLALSRGVLPPTINLQEADPAVAVHCVPNQARQGRAEARLS